ncbi:MAG: SRPBCC family protein [Deltaproteobacteria bacterium]|nr:SRPBCC family protein [Deltaproteobacteria bacterium]
MANQIQHSQVVHASLAPTWSAISRMGAVQDWHPNVARSQVLTDHDSGIGASRRVEFQDGNSVVETVVEESESGYTTMEMSEMPLLDNAFVTIRITERSDDETEVTFSIDYRLRYGPLGWLINALMMKRMLRKAFETALAGLSHHLETGDLIADSVPAPTP